MAAFFPWSDFLLVEDGLTLMNLHVRTLKYHFAGTGTICLLDDAAAGVFVVYDGVVGSYNIVVHDAGLFALDLSCESVFFVHPTLTVTILISGFLWGPHLSLA